MCTVENINKIAQILKVNPGKLGYNQDKVSLNISDDV